MRSQYTLTCPQCEQPFITEDRRRRYCSRACGGAANSGATHYRWNDRAPYTNHYGYVFVYAPEHPSAPEVGVRVGYVREHIIVAERTIGRRLRPDECVHHKNREKADNRPENLQVLTFSEHTRLHNTDVEPWFTDETLIAALHELTARLGRNPRKRDLDLFPDLPGRKAYLLHFGTWNAALTAAGMPINQRRP